MNSSSDKTGEMLAAIHELTRQNERLTTELGAAQESLDLFERYRSMTQEYMNMCICSSRDYLNGQYKQCEHDYGQLTRKGSITTSKNTSLSSSSSSSASSSVLCNTRALTIELKNGNTSKSKVRTYLDSLQRINYSDRNESNKNVCQFDNVIMNNSNCIFKRHSSLNDNSLLKPSPKSIKLDFSHQIVQLNNFLTSRLLPQQHFVDVDESDDDDDDDDDNNNNNNNNNNNINININNNDDVDDDEINLDSSPPPLLSRRMLFGLGENEQKSESILSAMLENGSKQYQINNNNKSKSIFLTSPITGLLTKYDENNNSKRTHLTYEERSTIIDRLKRHEPGAKIAREYGITKQAVSAIKRRANIVINEPCDVSLIVKKSASLSPESDRIHPVAMKKFSRKFPKEMNALCLPVNPVELIKNQLKQNDSFSRKNDNNNIIINGNNNNFVSFFNQKSSQLKNCKNDSAKSLEMSSNALLLSQLLKGEGVQQYDKHSESLLIDSSKTESINIPSSSEDEQDNNNSNDNDNNNDHQDLDHNNHIEIELKNHQNNNEDEKNEVEDNGVSEDEPESESLVLNRCSSIVEHASNSSSLDLFDNSSNHYLNDLSSPTVSADHSL